MSVDSFELCAAREEELVADLGCSVDNRVPYDKPIESLEMLTRWLKDGRL